MLNFEVLFYILELPNATLGIYGQSLGVNVPRLFPLRGKHIRL
jgi:hypothetical protein